MLVSSNELDRFRKIFNIPDFIFPWLDRFFTHEEIHLVLLVAEKPLGVTEIAEAWNAGELPIDLTRLQELVDRSATRGIVCRGDGDRLRPADFHARFDSWSMFEGWMDIPDEICGRLNAWELEHYIQQHVDQVETLKNGGYRDGSLVWPEYVLLPEAEALIDTAGHVYLWPCNCRSMMGRCAKNVYTCLRFSNHRDVGWEISKSRAKNILYNANKSGLMQNAEISISPNDSISGAICNCCADCCFPHQLAERMDAAKLWPLTRYVAGYLVERCTGCGSCVKRCPFNAFTCRVSEKTGKSNLVGRRKEKRTILFDSSLCRGCGVCSTGCPANAIEMIRLDHIRSAWESRLGFILC